MSSWKRADFDRAFPVDRPPAIDPNIRLYVFAGSEESGTRELAGRAVRAMADASDPLSVTDIPAGELAGDPGRLPDEAASVPMFGGTRVIRVTGAGEAVAEAAQLLLAAPAAGNPVVFQAGDLTKANALRKLAEDHDLARFLFSYPLDAREASRWLMDAASALGLKPEPGVGERLVSAADGDVGVLGQELEKFALYLEASPAAPKRLTASDFARLGADGAENDQYALVQAATIGDMPRFERQLSLLAGTSAIPVLRAMSRRLFLLADLRAAMDSGSTPRAAVERARPPVHFKERHALTESLSAWPERRIRAGLSAMLRAEEAIKAPHSVGDVLGWQALLTLALAPERRRA